MYGLPSVPAMKQIISRVKNIATPFVNFFRPCGESQSAPFGAQAHSVLRTWGMNFAFAYAVKHNALWPPSIGIRGQRTLNLLRQPPLAPPFASSPTQLAHSPSTFFLPSLFLFQASFEAKHSLAFNQCPIAQCPEHRPLAPSLAFSLL